ncbi:hypothetical protein DV736_g5704, partial [Chaetothyriales sp. CBS 134916]
MEPRYHYQPLPSDGEARFFRLLTLEPDSVQNPVVCRLRVARIPLGASSIECDPYDALSYVWGDEEPSYEIILDAWPIRIRENLWEFLRQSRHTSQPVTLWVDALCIDQSNLTERSIQVQSMAQIYGSATRVIVWLGPGDASSVAAMQLINHASKSSGKLLPNHSTSVHLQDWAFRSYWTRTWVVQEFLLATDLIIICGEHMLSWQAVQRLLWKVSSSHSAVADNQYRQAWSPFRDSPAYALMQQRNNSSQTRPPLLKLMVNNRSTRCRVPHDRVFAMLGLAADSVTERIQISYGQDIRLLLMEVLRLSDVPAKDVTRYIRFLSRLLGVDTSQCKTKAPEVSPLFKDNRPLWDTTAFVTGRVVRSELLRDEKPSVFVISDPGLLDRLTSRYFCKVRRTDFMTMLSALDKVNVSELHLPGDMPLRERNSHGSATSKNDSSEPCASLVIVIASGCAEPQFLVGVAFGKIKHGDVVAHFLGHECALTLDAGDLQGSSQRFTGRLQCARTSSTDTNTDAMTHERLSYFNIQSEAECTAPAERIDLVLTPTQAFQLGRCPPS